MTAQSGAAQGSRRADARRNIAAILEAATTCLARDPDASLKTIAEAAGVGRVTLYGHFDSRSTLVGAVVDRAMAQTEADLSVLDLSGDPREAMSELMSVTWDLTHRFGALVVAAERVLPADRLKDVHEQPAARVRRLLARGRRSGVFDKEVPLEWQVTTVHAIVHAASEATYRGELTPEKARRLVARTVLAALRPE